MTLRLSSIAPTGLLAAMLLGACGGGIPLRSASPRARLVVVAVFDQLGSDALAVHLPHLDPDGAIRTTLARGQHIHRARYAYASTFTAPGHVAVHSGASPRESGVGSNRVHRRGRGRVSVADDGEHSVLSREGAFASPSVLRAETVADVLAAERPSSIVASLAMKDRSAVLPGGQRPDLCLWFDPRAGGFTTSSYYAAALPAWLEAFRASAPRMGDTPPWEPRDAAALERWFGPDAQPGEGAYGLDATFPHDVRGLSDPDAYLSTPAGTEQLFAVAREAVRELDMGRDVVPDLLAISIAATDYAGHAFGPRSWEYADTLARADAALGAFLRDLERERGPIAVLITSDHGAAELVERTPGAVRWSSEGERAALEEHLREVLGPPPEGALAVARTSGMLPRRLEADPPDSAWVAGWAQPYVTLGPTEPALRARALEATLSWLRGRPGIALAVDAARVARGPTPAGDTLEAVVARAIPDPPPGDVFVMPSEGSAALEDMPEGLGTSHGSAWAYDRDVPVLFAGPGVAQGEARDAAPQCRVAGTIAALLGVRAPAHACGAW